MVPAESIISSYECMTHVWAFTRRSLLTLVHLPIYQTRTLGRDVDLWPWSFTIANMFPTEKACLQLGLYAVY